MRGERAVPSRGGDPPNPPAPSGRAEYLAEVCGLLWPAPASATPVRGRSGAADAELIVVPSLADPRLLLPPGRRAAAAAVRRYGEPASARARLSGRALQVMLASGTGRVLLRDRIALRVPPGAPAIDDYLRRQLGHEVALSIHLGAPRANRKPVLQLLTPGGRTVAFAKIGVTELTRRLVHDERAALDRVRAAGLTAVTAPAVRHLGSWQGLEVLILDALPVWEPRREPGAGRLSAAMGEVARLAGSVTEPAGGYLGRLAARLDEVPDGADRRALAPLLDALRVAAGDRVLEVGAWHGDWTPWNMACTSDGLLVWDWERFATGVPVGFDALHFWLQSAVARAGADPAAAAADCVRRAPDLLGPLGADPAAARLTALAYLCELSVRYLADRQAEAGARLGAPGRWLIPALAAASRPGVPA